MMNLREIEMQIHRLNKIYDGISRVKTTTEFVLLTDGPGSFSGHAGESIRVNGAENKLEYFAAGGGGTVTNFVFTNANGVSGNVSTATTIPTLSLSFTPVGILKSNGTTLSAAVAGADYLAINGSAASLTSFPTLNQNTTGSAASLSANLPVSRLNSGTLASASTYWKGDGSWGTPNLVMTAVGTGEAVVFDTATDVLFHKAIGSSTFISASTVSNSILLSLSATGTPGSTTALFGDNSWKVVSALTDGDKGSITVSSSGTVWTIDNAAISAAMLNTTGTPNGLKFLRDDFQWTTLAGGGDAVTTNPLSQFAATTSAQLAGVISDETGTDKLVLNTSPLLVTPRLAATSTVGHVWTATDTSGNGSFQAASGGGSGDMVLASVQTNTGAKTFNNNTLLLAGSTSGTLTLVATAISGTNTITFPAATGTVGLLNGTNSWSAAATFAGVTNNGSLVQLGGLLTASTSSTGNLYAQGSSVGQISTQAELRFGSAAQLTGRVWLRGSTALTPAAGDCFAHFVVGQQVTTIFSSGAHPIGAGAAFLAPVTNSGTGTLTDSTNVYIQGPPTGTETPTNPATALWVHSGNVLITNGNITLGTAGNKLNIATGSNASIGVSSAMTAGTITISTTAVTASSKIFLTRNTTGGTVGVLEAPTASIVAATSFVINSSSALDTSTVNWIIIN